MKKSDWVSILGIFGYLFFMYCIWDLPASKFFGAVIGVVVVVHSTRWIERNPDGPVVRSGYQP